MERNIRTQLRELLTAPYAGTGARDDELDEMQIGLGFRLPDDYLDFLRETNGYTGEVGRVGYVAIWPAAEVLPTNEANHFRERIPGFVLFASNEGSEMYASDMRSAAPKVVAIPAIPLEIEFAVEVGSSFVDFIDRLAAQG